MKVKRRRQILRSQDVASFVVVDSKCKSYKPCIYYRIGESPGDMDRSAGKIEFNAMQKNRLNDFDRKTFNPCRFSYFTHIRGSVVKRNCSSAIVRFRG